MSTPSREEKNVRALPKGFRKLGQQERIEAARELYGGAEDEWMCTAGSPIQLDLAEVMTESSIGVLSLPLGIAQGFLIDGKIVDIPLATEEPSVIAACAFGAKIIRQGGGFTTWADEPVMTAQVFLEECDPESLKVVLDAEEKLKEHIAPCLERMTKRGGGYRGLDADFDKETTILKVEIHIDVRDAMGANLLNTIAETVKKPLEKLIGGKTLMGILTNEASRRMAGARFSLPIHLLPGSMEKTELARRICKAAEIACVDPSRGVTHNKGIMNGVTALALATGNDTRGLEAAVHTYACSEGYRGGHGGNSADRRYRALSRFTIQGENLIGEITMPLPFAAVGGAVGFHPTSRLALKILRNPDARRLSGIAAAVGLAQNFAALRALVSEGIQRGHMRLHASRLAFRSGARGKELSDLSEAIWKEGRYNLETAQKLLEKMREE
jgi:hydroxymethylglutaryl-CoA reductase